MNLGGYVGKILRVNLATRETHEENLSQDLAIKFMGGSGLGAYYLYKELKAGVDPLGEENKLLFFTGPITGTSWPTAGRSVFLSKSPLTGIYAESHVGGFLGPEFKYAGYDGLIIEGRSDKPTNLTILDDQVNLEDAKKIMGLNTAESTSLLLEDFHPDAQVAVIGPAGEKLSRTSSIIINMARAAGRCGLGAVMGSKNLKTIAVKGTGGVSVQEPEAFKVAVDDVSKRILTDIQAMEQRKFGTNLLVALKSQIGELVTKNHSRGTFENAEVLMAEHLRENYFQKTRACFACRVGCKKQYRVEEGPFACESEGPEYESVMAFGTNCLNDDFGAILRCNQLCNLYGMDAISVGCTIAFAMELFERGILTTDVLGFPLEWGDASAIVRLVEMIGKREGIGSELAEGSWAFAQKIGPEAMDSVMTVKKMEISGQDGRTHRSMALGHATAARGADHLRSLVIVDQLSYQDVAAERFGKHTLPEICDPYTEQYKAIATKLTEDVYALRDSLITCWYTCSWPAIIWMDDFLRVLPLATGIKAFGEENHLRLMGERLVTLKRMFNVREGITRKDDQLPKRFSEPMPDGPGKGAFVTLDPMLDEYYELRGWDENGIPTKETLSRLNLDF